MSKIKSNTNESLKSLKNLEPTEIVAKSLTGLENLEPDKDAGSNSDTSNVNNQETDKEKKLP